MAEAATGQEGKCVEQVQSVRVLTGRPQGGHPPPPIPAEAPPTPPALPNHRRFRQNSGSFLYSRCRLHGRPYGLTQGFTNSTVSMQSGKWWGGWPSLAGCSACTCVWPCVCTRLYKDPPPLLRSPRLIQSRIQSAVLIPPSHVAGPGGLPEMTPLEPGGSCLPRSPTPLPVCRMSVEAPPTCPSAGHTGLVGQVDGWTDWEGVWIWVPLTPP